MTEFYSISAWKTQKNEILKVVSPPATKKNKKIKKQKKKKVWLALKLNDLAERSSLFLPQGGKREKNFAWGWGFFAAKFNDVFLKPFPPFW